MRKTKKVEKLLIISKMACPNHQQDGMEEHYGGHDDGGGGGGPIPSEG